MCFFRGIHLNFLKNENDREEINSICFLWWLMKYAIKIDLDFIVFIIENCIIVACKSRLSTE